MQITDDTLSGTTAVCMLIRGREVTICNVGDSRCVAAEMRGAELAAVDLTSDQTPYRCICRVIITLCRRVPILLWSGPC